MLGSGENGKINSRLGRWDRWLPAVFFLFVLGMYLMLLIDQVFVDELDVFYGGYNIVKSGDLYRFYPTQHMPFSYYIAAVIALFGARTAFQFRVGFYVLLSLGWTGMYIRYRKHFSRLALLCMPVLYLAQLRMHSLGTSMVSDHWQGIGLVIVLMELLLYSRRKRISAGAACMISAGIVLSFGTTFLSAYPLLIVFLGVAAMQVCLIAREKQPAVPILREDGRLVLICLCPFAVLILWYLVTGNLGNAIGGAYDLNVNVYSKYLNGFGTSPGSTLIWTIPNWFSYQKKAIEYLTTGPRWAVQIFAQTASLIALVWSLIREKKVIAGITFLLAVIMTGVRAFDGFHGAPYMAVTCIPMAFCLDASISAFVQKRQMRHAVPALISLGFALAMVAPEIPTVTGLYYLPQLLSNPVYAESNQGYLEVLTEPGERIHTGDISVTSGIVMKEGLRLDEYTPAISNPWFYEYYGERELAALKKNRTRIVVYDPDGEIWGYTVREYAPDFVQYVEENYTPVTQDVYVLNEDYPAARETLRRIGYGTRTAAMPGVKAILGDMMEDGKSLEQRFTADGGTITAVQAALATYIGKNKAGAVATLLDGETGEVLATSALPRQEIKDGVKTRFAMHAETEAGKDYIVRIETDGTTPAGKSTGLHLYRHEDGSAQGTTAAYANGERQDFNWIILIEYDE